MATYTVNPSFPSITADEGFNLARSALPEAGFAVWKERPLGWLIMANKQTDQGNIQTTLSFRPGRETTMSLSLTSDQHSEEQLESTAGQFLQQFKDKLLS